MAKATSKIKSKGVFTLTLIGPDGKVKQRKVAPNVVTDVGLNHLRSYVFRGCSPTVAPDPMCYIGIGTNNTPATGSDVALGSELAREAFETWTDGGVGTIVVSTTFAAGVGTGAITECGMFNDALAGDMFDRSVFSTVNKEAGDTLKVAYSIVFMNG
jgi:hypothetical protein